MSNTVLALSMRPKSLDDLIGAEKIVERIRRRMSSHRIPRSWMFCGGTGSGKTTIMRIIARSLQCTHHKKFGEYCSRCYKQRHEFDIVEINASDMTGIEAMRDIVEFATYHPHPGSKRRIYILDEVHMQSASAQNLLLKYTEEAVSTTVFMLGTTNEEKVIRALRRRCKTYVMPQMDLKNMTRLVRRAMRRIHCKLESRDLIEKLMEKDVTSAGLILNAVESYSEGASAEEATEVESISEVVTKGLIRSLIKGEWEDVASHLRHATPEDVAKIQGAVSKYLFGILIGEKDFSSRNRVVSKGIQKLANLQGSDNVKHAALGAVLYEVAHYFKEYSR